MAKKTFQQAQIELTKNLLQVVNTEEEYFWLNSELQRGTHGEIAGPISQKWLVRSQPLQPIEINRRCKTGYYRRFLIKDHKQECIETIEIVQKFYNYLIIYKINGKWIQTTFIHGFRKDALDCARWFKKYLLNKKVKGGNA